MRIKLSYLIVIIAACLISGLGAGRALAYGVTDKFQVGAAETVVSNIQRKALGLNAWTDGNIGFFSYAGQGRAVAANGGSYATINSSASNFLESVVTASSNIQSIKEPADYAGGGPIYTDVSSGKLFMFYHGELNQTTPGAFWSFIGMAYSTDGGSTFTDLGRIITPNAPYNPSGFTVDVMGAAYYLKDGYIYVTFKDRMSDGVFNNLAVARASISDIITAAESGNVASWMKYYNNSFSEAGIGGKSQNIFNYPSTIYWLDIIYLSSISKYTMVYTSGADPTFQFISTSSDGINWEEPRLLYSQPASGQIYYVSLSSDNYNNPKVSASDTFYAYRTNSLLSTDRWLVTSIEKFPIKIVGNNQSNGTNSNSTSYSALASTGQSQIRILIVASLIIALSILAAVFLIELRIRKISKRSK